MIKRKLTWKDSSWNSLYDAVEVSQMKVGDTLIYESERMVIEKLKDSRPDFFQLNTRVTIENGMITEINRRWIP